MAIVSGQRDLPSDTRTFIAAKKGPQSSARRRHVKDQNQDLMLNRCRGTTASDVCLQALILSLTSPCDFFTLSPNREPVHRLYPVMVINTAPELRTILLQKVFFHFNRFEKQMDTRKV